MQHQGVYEALYDYAPQSEEELGLKEQQILLLVEIVDADWASVVDMDFSRGLVPWTYIQEKTAMYSATALYDYSAQNSQELSLGEGGSVVVYAHLDADWCLVAANGMAGLVPLSYLESQDTQVTQSQSAEPLSLDGSAQKGKLLAALQGLGPAPQYKPVVAAAPQNTGAELAPTNIKYFKVVEIDKKKKKPLRQGLLGIADDFNIYFVNDLDMTIMDRFDARDIHKSFEKKGKKLVIEFNDGKVGEFEAERSDLLAMCSKLEEVKLRSKISGPILNGPPPVVGLNTDSPRSRPQSSVIESPKPPPVIPPSPASQGRPLSTPDTMTLQTPRLHSALATSSIPKKARALYEYAPQTDEEIPIQENYSLIVLDDSDPDWTMVQCEETGQKGLVPRTYIEMVDASPVTTVPSKQTQNTSSVTAKNQGTARPFADELAKALKPQPQQQQPISVEAPTVTKPSMPPRPTQPTVIHAPPRPPQAPSFEPPKPPPMPERPVMPSRPSEPEKPRPGRTSEPERPPAMPSRPALPQQSEEKPLKPSLPSRPTNSKPSTPSMPERPKATPTAASSASAAPTQFPDPDKLRVWKDTTGSFSVKAEFIEMKDGKAVLWKENGVKISVPLQKLCVEDREFLGVSEPAASSPSTPASSIQTKIPAPPALPGRVQTQKQQTNDQKPERLSASLRPSDSVSLKPPSQIDKKPVSFSYNSFDWLAFLLACSIPVDTAETYAAKFVQERMDKSTLEFVERPVLKEMGITEGDILRILKARDGLFKKEIEDEKILQENLRRLGALGMNLPEASSNQIKSDEEFARKLQEQELRGMSTSASSSRLPPMRSGAPPSGGVSVFAPPVAPVLTPNLTGPSSSSVLSNRRESRESASQEQVKDIRKILSEQSKADAEDLMLKAAIKASTAGMIKEEEPDTSPKDDPWKVNSPTPSKLDSFGGSSKPADSIQPSFQTTFVAPPPPMPPISTKPARLDPPLIPPPYMGGAAPQRRVSGFTQNVAPPPPRPSKNIIVGPTVPTGGDSFQPNNPIGMAAMSPMTSGFGAMQMAPSQAPPMNNMNLMAPMGGTGITKNVMADQRPEQTGSWAKNVISNPFPTNTSASTSQQQASNAMGLPASVSMSSSAGMGLMNQQSSGMMARPNQMMQPQMNPAMNTNPPMGSLGMNSTQLMGSMGMNSNQPIGSMGMNSNQPIGAMGVNSNQPMGSMGMNRPLIPVPVSQPMQQPQQQQGFMNNQMLSTNQGFGGMQSMGSGFNPQGFGMQQPSNAAGNMGGMNQLMGGDKYAALRTDGGNTNFSYQGMNATIGFNNPTNMQNPMMMNNNSGFQQQQQPFGMMQPNNNMAMMMQQQQQNQFQNGLNPNMNNNGMGMGGANQWR